VLGAHLVKGTVPRGSEICLVARELVLSGHENVPITGLTTDEAPKGSHFSSLFSLMCSSLSLSPTLRACLERWPVGSAALPGAQFRVWPPFHLPRPGPLEAKPPPPLGSSRTPFSTVARGLGSARRWAGDFGALCAGGRWPWRARAGEGKVPPALLRREIHGL
jgi:hypothetical protein